MSNFEKDWEQFEELTPLLDAGIVHYLEDTSSIFKGMMQSFPILSYRIDWMKMNSIYLIIQRADPAFSETITEFIETICEEVPIVEGQMLNIIFDGYTEGGVQMNASTLKEMAHTFFSIAQHTFVLPETFEWCINYTFEGYLHFGIRNLEEFQLKNIYEKLSRSGLNPSLLGDHSH